MYTYRSGRDFESLRRELLRTRSRFEDPEFSASNRSLMSFTALPRNLPARNIVWKRPAEIVQENDEMAKPKFVTGSFSRADLDQGYLGNCWFVAAASVLVTGPREQFERVVPLDQSFEPGEYAGIFHFYFWRYGEWTEVIVDDLLPTDGKKLIYCKNRQEPDEFWCALLEKAYAKVYGSYEALARGVPATALVDLTGGVGEIIRLVEKYKVPKNFFELLVKNSQMNSLLVSGIYARPGQPRRKENGLYQNHAYSITDLIQIPVDGKMIKLMRVRNPHGRREWKGAWSDKSKEMQSLPNDIKLQYKMEDIDDGEFWMSYEDFVKSFDEIQMCHIEPDRVGTHIAYNTGKQNWNMIQYHGEWIRYVSAGGSGNPPYKEQFWLNPQYQLQLKDPDPTDSEHRCTVIISLMEKEHNDGRRVAIGFDIYKVRGQPYRPLNEDEKLTERELIHKEKYGKYDRYREIVKRFSLFPGYYVVIPSTYKPNMEAKFLLRIYTEKQAYSGVISRSGTFI